MLKAIFHTSIPTILQMKKREGVCVLCPPAVWCRSLLFLVLVWSLCLDHKVPKRSNNENPFHTARLDGEEMVDAPAALRVAQEAQPSGAPIASAKIFKSTRRRGRLLFCLEGLLAASPRARTSAAN